jgi:hypothetical protein
MFLPELMSEKKVNYVATWIHPYTCCLPTLLTLPLPAYSTYSSNQATWQHFISLKSAPFFRCINELLIPALANVAV